MNAEFKIGGRQIETERLILRAFEDADLDDFYEYASVEGVGEQAGWRHHESRDETRQILNNFIKNDKTFALVWRSSGKVIGSLGVEEYGMEDRLTEFSDYRGRELGFVLSREYWGRGIMPEAVRAVVDFLFEKENLDFLLCGYYDFNARSRRVQEKCGFAPYRRLVGKTRLGTKEPMTLNLLTNPRKNITLSFSHPETLVWGKKTQ